MYVKYNSRDTAKQLKHGKQQQMSSCFSRELLLVGTNICVISCLFLRGSIFQTIPMQETNLVYYNTNDTTVIYSPKSTSNLAHTTGVIYFVCLFVYVYLSIQKPRVKPCFQARSLIHVNFWLYRNVPLPISTSFSTPSLSIHCYIYYACKFLAI